eukprot:scaffold141074_cov78-Attheya_sp.AAC.1
MNELNGEPNARECIHYANSPVRHPLIPHNPILILHAVSVLDIASSTLCPNGTQLGRYAPQLMICRNEFGRAAQIFLEGKAHPSAGVLLGSPVTHT